MEQTQTEIERGSFSWENWKAKLAAEPLRQTSEYPLFTDTRITGEVSDGLGPYQLLNAVPTVDSDLLLPYIVLRIEFHSNADREDWKKTNVERYHGGGLQDEVAALVSLCLGIRMKSGGISRLFQVDKDPRGHPTQWEIDKNPILSKPFRRKSVLPHALEEHSLDETAPIAQLVDLSAKASVALVRSARLYQDALWVAESEPELSWLLLVSAVETAAGYWRSETDSAIDRLKAARPELETVLLEAGGEQLLSRVANMMADYMGATKKFVDFIMEFLPDPPAKRPPEIFQISWKREEMVKSFRKIYDWRSRALHGGIPFPAPMCMAPGRHDNAPHEVVMGLATSTRGAVWVTKDTPMLLHVFEHIVRNALLSWWRQMIPETRQIELRE